MMPLTRGRRESRRRIQPSIALPGPIRFQNHRAGHCHDKRFADATGIPVNESSDLACAPLQTKTTRQSDKVTELILIRHGETAWNADQRIQGHTDIALNRNGLAQAAAIGKRFENDALDVLISSDLQRAMQTMAPIAEGRNLPVLPDQRLRERHLGILQGKSREQAQRDMPRVYDVFRSRLPDAELEGGESLNTFAARVIDVLGELTETHRNKRIVAVTHGGVLDIAYRHATGTTLEAARTFTIHNASINTFRVEGSRLVLVDWGDISHLPDNLAMDEI